MLHPSFLLCAAPTRSSALPIRLDRLRARARAAALSPLSIGGSAANDSLAHCVDVVVTLPGATAAQRHSLGRALTSTLALEVGRAPFLVTVTAGGQRINGRRDPRLQHPASAALRTARTGRTIRRTVRSLFSENTASLPFLSSSDVFKARDRVLSSLPRPSSVNSQIARNGTPHRPRIVFSTLPLLSSITVTPVAEVTRHLDRTSASVLSRQLIRPLHAEGSSVLGEGNFFTPNTITSNSETVATGLVVTRSTAVSRALPSFLVSPTIVEGVGGSLSHTRASPIVDILKLIAHFATISSAKSALFHLVFVTRWYSGCADGLQIHRRAVRSRLGSNIPLTQANLLRGDIAQLAERMLCKH